MVPHERKRLIKILIDREIYFVPEKITVSDALEFAGFPISSAPCGVGGCFACAEMIDSETKPACVTEAVEGTQIDTVGQGSPLRVVLDLLRI